MPGISEWSNMMSIYLKSFPFSFLSSYALFDKILTTWYPLTNFLSKGFLVKFLTKTCVPTLYLGSILAYLSLFLALWVLIHLHSFSKFCLTAVGALIHNLHLYTYVVPQVPLVLHRWVPYRRLYIRATAII